MNDDEYNDSVNYDGYDDYDEGQSIDYLRATSETPIGIELPVLKRHSVDKDKISKLNIDILPKYDQEDMNGLTQEEYGIINESMDPMVMRSKVGILDPRGIYKNPLNGKEFSDKYRLYAETNANIDELATQADIDKVIREKGGNSDDPSGWMYGKVYKERNLFFKKLMTCQVMLVIAGTGTGKTVAIPKLLSHYFGYKKKIMVTVPTIPMAIGAAEYAAILMDVNVHEEVATGVSGVNKSPPHPKRKFLYATSDFGKAVYNGDPELSKYAGVIIDETHYRKLSQDYMLSVVSSLIREKRPDFKLIIMSATVSAKPFEEYFRRMGVVYQLYEPQGAGANRKITEIFYPEPLNYKKLNDIQDVRMVETIDKLLKSNTKGHILGFVSSEPQGKKIIMEIKKRINANPDAYPSNPWCNTMSGQTEGKNPKIARIMTGKDTYIGEDDISGPNNPDRPFNRKLIMATEAIEASVTISIDPVDRLGLYYVVESGVSFKVAYNSEVDCDKAGLSTISQAAIGQRRGRTGRTNDGYCLYMYSQKDLMSFPLDRVPEISSTNITPILLELLGVPSIKKFGNALKFLNDMMMPPDDNNLRNATFRLIKNGLLSLKTQELTLQGFICRKLSKYDIYLPRLLLAGWYFQCMPEAITLAGCLNICSSNGIGDLVKPSKLDNNGRMQIDTDKLKKWIIPGSEHLTLLKIYLSTTDFSMLKYDKQGKNVKEEKRQEFCDQNNFNYKNITRIDYAIRELKKELRGDLLINIIKTNMFNIHGFDRQKEMLAKINVLETMSGGAQQIRHQQNKPYPQQQPRQNKPYPQQQQRQQQNKKKSMKRQTQKKNIYPKKNIVNVKNKQLEKIKEKKDRERKDENEKIQFAMKHLDKIQIDYDTISKNEIKMSTNVYTNVLTCLFFAYSTQIACKLKKDTYLAKHINDNSKSLTFTIDKKSIFKVKPGRQLSSEVSADKPEIIIYGSGSVSDYGKDLSLVTRIPWSIIEKFKETFKD